MANVKISDLTALSGEIALTTLFEAELAGGGSVKVTASQFAELVRDTIFAALVQAGIITITQNDASDTITISATASGGGGSAGPIMHPGYASGIAYSTYEQGQSGTGTVTPDALVAVPVTTRFDVTVSAFLMRVSTAAAGGLCRVARYANAAGVPGALIAESNVVLDLSTNNVTLAATFAANQMLAATTPSWLVLLFNTAAQVNGAQLFSQAAADTRARSVFGSPTGPFDIGAVTASYVATRPYADGFPAMYPAVSRTTASPPMCWFRPA